jgi:type I restriction enzyme R subunit
MIEFKQIIGRGTRLYEGKDFFTVFDFVKAHYNFADPEWDGEPLPPEPPGDPDTTGEGEGGKEKPPGPVTPPGGDTPTVEKITIKLSDGKTREIQHISSVMYWSADGKPITAKEFVERMFDDLPQFFENEDQLRGIWSNPNTREKLLEDLSEAGYDEEKLDSMKDLIDAKYSDVYDVLAYVAYAAETHTRKERAVTAKPLIANAFADHKQLEFIEFVLDKYVEDGVRELATSKMESLATLKYNTINDATAVLGSPKVIRETFVGFQKYLYQVY